MNAHRTDPAIRLVLVWFAQLDTTSSYAGHVLPGLIVHGIGMGNIFGRTDVKAVR